MIKEIIHASAARSLASLGSAQLVPRRAEELPEKPQREPRGNQKTTKQLPGEAPDSSQTTSPEAPREGPEELPRGLPRGSILAPLSMPKCMVFYWFYNNLGGRCRRTRKSMNPRWVAAAESLLAQSPLAFVCGPRAARGRLRRRPPSAAAALRAAPRFARRGLASLGLAELRKLLKFAGDNFASNGTPLAK